MAPVLAGVALRIYNVIVALLAKIKLNRENRKCVRLYKMYVKYNLKLNAKIASVYVCIKFYNYSSQIYCYSRSTIVFPPLRITVADIAAAPVITVSTLGMGKGKLRKATEGWFAGVFIVPEYYLHR
jgi:hypothetical protein